MNASRVVLIFICLTISVLWAEGNVTYSLQKATNPTEDQLDAYARIEAAMDSAVFMYNKYTSLSKKITVYYDVGVPTAQANFDGVISFGSNRSYMVVGTAMHEMGHVFGVGTTSEYKNLIVDGVFQGAQTTAKIIEIEGKANAVIQGDGTHFWPYGLNYASEIKSEQDLIYHCWIIDAMYKDFFKEELFFTGKLKSDQGLCMVRSDHSLLLGDCEDPLAIVKLYRLGDKAPYTYRLEFGELVLDVPNETTAPNTEVGLYRWNGKNHQRVLIDSTAGGRVTLKMNHGNLYLEAQNNRIVQVLPSASNANQKWSFLSLGDEPSVSILRHKGVKFSQNKRQFHVDLKGRVLPSQKRSRFQKRITIDSP